MSQTTGTDRRQPTEAIFAAGCFWGVQYYFDQVPGVLATEAGYTGGHYDRPSYWDVVSHITGHVEAVRLEYDPKKISYTTLLKHFFKIQDPTSKLAPDGINHGETYRSAVFYMNDQQKIEAENLKEQLNHSGQYKKPIITAVEPAGKWWPAEEFHQKFTEKTGRGMCHVPYAPI